MANPPKPIPQMTVAQFEARFPEGDEEACLRYLVARRWSEGVRCTRCGNAEVCDASGYKPFHWQCTKCGTTPYRFSALVGTMGSLPSTAELKTEKAPPEETIKGAGVSPYSALARALRWAVTGTDHNDDIVAMLAHDIPPGALRIVNWT
ncbi:MAG: transposase [Xanthobacteraceae bacterium]